MPAAMPPVRIIDHICALASAWRAASSSAAACLAAVVSKGMEATVMSSPRAWSSPTALPTRDWICCWLRLLATASSITTETVSRLIAPGALWTVSVVVSTELFAVVDSFWYVELPPPALLAASGMFSGPRTPPTGAPDPLYSSVVVLSRDRRGAVGVAVRLRLGLPLGQVQVGADGHHCAPGADDLV